MTKTLVVSWCIMNKMILGIVGICASKKLWKSYEEFATLCVEEGVCAPRTPGRALLASCPA